MKQLILHFYVRLNVAVYVCMRDNRKCRYVYEEMPNFHMFIVLSLTAVVLLKRFSKNTDRHSTIPSYIAKVHNNARN